MIRKKIFYLSFSLFALFLVDHRFSVQRNDIRRGERYGDELMRLVKDGLKSSRVTLTV
jgi:hypothetical protein